MRYFTLILGLLAVVTLVGHSPADDVHEEWVASYDFDGWDAAYYLAVDDGGYVYVTGSVHYSGTYNNDWCTIKYDSEGVEQWIAMYSGGGIGYDCPSGLAVDHDGYVYVTGTIYNEEEIWELCTIKYDNDGNEVWVAKYLGPGNDEGARDLEIDEEGNVYIISASSGLGTHYDYCTIKYDNDGNEQWVARYNGPGNDWDEPLDVEVDEMGNIYVVGASFGSGTDLDYCTIKYDNNGNEEWVVRYDNLDQSYDVGWRIAVDDYGNACVTGVCKGIGGHPWDIYTIKYDNEGNRLWVAVYDGPVSGADDPRGGIVLDREFNVYVAGWSKVGSGQYDYDFCTIKYDRNGNEIWVATYDGPSSRWDAANGIAIDNYDNIYITGESDGIGRDYCTVKYDSDGNELWVARYDGDYHSWDKAWDVEVDDNFYVYVTGQARIKGNNVDFCTIKYGQTYLGVEVTYFEAKPTQDCISLRWIVEESEGEQLAGFNLYRQEALTTEPISLGENSSPKIISWERLNTELITCQNPYHFTDADVQDRMTYEYRLEAVYERDWGEFCENLGTTQATAGVPTSFAILALYPNPASNYLTCLLALPDAGMVELSLYDLSGRLVLRERFDVDQPTELEAVLDVSRLASGIYTLRAYSAGAEVFDRAVLVK